MYSAYSASAPACRYEDLMLDNPPIFRETKSALDAAMQSVHPLDIKSSGLCRYTCTPVFDSVVVNGTAVAGSLLGFLVTTDLVSGNAARACILISVRDSFGL